MAFVPNISWETKIGQVNLSSTGDHYYECTLPIKNLNDKGAGTLTTGLYLIDYLGYFYEIVSIINSSTNRVEVYDINEGQQYPGASFKAPYQDMVGFVCELTGGGVGLSVSQLRRLHNSARDVINYQDNLIIWNRVFDNGVEDQIVSMNSTTDGFDYLDIVNTNTVDFTQSASELNADLVYQNSATINLTDDASGLKANLSHLGIEDLTDPNANKLLYWDDTAGNLDWANVTWIGSEFDIGGTLIINSTYQFPIVDGSNNEFLYTDGGGALSWGWKVLDEDDFASNSATNLATHQSIKTYVDSSVSTGDRLDYVIEMQTDSTTDPGTSPATGDRYIILDASNLNSNFGTISGLEDNDIVEYDGADFVVTFDASAASAGVVVTVGLDKNGNSDHDWAYNHTDDKWVDKGGVPDHGSLVGLGDDDHSQYLLLSGRTGQTIDDTINVTGNLSEQNKRIWSDNYQFTAGNNLSWDTTITPYTLDATNTQLTQEEVQDYVGAILDDGSVGSVVFNYDDANNIISGNVDGGTF